MNNLDTLWAYIRKHVPSEGIEDADGGPVKFRDLKQYHEKKVSRWVEVGKTQRRRAEELIDDPLGVCQLRRTDSELNARPSRSSAGRGHAAGDVDCAEFG